MIFLSSFVLKIFLCLSSKPFIFSPAFSCLVIQDEQLLEQGSNEEDETVVALQKKGTETKKRQVEDVTSAIKELKDRVNALEAAKALPKTADDEKQDKLTVDVSSDYQTWPLVSNIHQIS